METKNEDTVRARIVKTFMSKADFSAGTMRVTDGTSKAPAHRGVAKFNAKFMLSAGDEVTLRGRWVKHPRFGEQMEVTHVEMATDLDISGFADFLARSNTFEGIGPSRAKALAKALAALGNGDICDGLKSSTDEIAAKSGLKPDIVERVKRVWSMREEANRVLADLATFGITPNAGMKLLDSEGPNIVNIVRRDPYYLLRKGIRGFGFKRVDEIALRVGIEPLHPSRLAEGTLHVLREAERDGNTCVPKKKLLIDAAVLMRLREMPERLALKNRLAEMEDSDIVVLANEGRAEKEEFVWTRPMIRSELLISSWFIEQGKKRHGLLIEEDGTIEIERYLSENTLNQKQLRAVEAAATFGVSCICGGAGVGKTYTIESIVEMFRERGITDIAICAPTGKAAKRIEQSSRLDLDASTIHMLLGPRMDHATGDFSFEHDDKNPLEYSVIIVDEVSMVDVYLMASLLRAIKKDRTCLVLVGDHNQLPSVGPGAILRDLFAHQPCKLTVLTDVHRQAGMLKTNTIAVLDGVIRPQDPTAAMQKSGDQLKPWYVFDRKLQPAKVVMFIEDMLNERLALYCIDDGSGSVRGVDPLNDVQLLTPQNKGILGVEFLNLIAQRIFQRKINGVELPEPVWDASKIMDTRLMVGDKVINTRNNYELGVMNGTIGIVTAVSENKTATPYDPCDIVSPIGCAHIEFEGAGSRVVSGTALDRIRLAYAITVHKSQGSEFPIVILVVHKTHRYMQHRNLIYTGVSRAQKTCVIVGDPWGVHKMVQITKVNDRNTLAQHGPAFVMEVAKTMECSL